MMFVSARNSCFAMTFENGWTVSVAFGTGNSCDRKWDGNGDFNEPMRHFRWETHTAEIAAWDANDDCYDFGGGDVDYDDITKGWCKPEEVAEFIAMVSQFTGDISTITQNESEVTG